MPRVRWTTTSVLTRAVGCVGVDAQSLLVSSTSGGSWDSASDVINSGLETVIITTLGMSARGARRIGMELRQVSGGVIVAVFVKPNSKQFQLKVEDDTLVALCRETPVKGKVNKELIKELSRIFKNRVEIVTGFTSKQKTILIASINIDEANKILLQCVSK